LEAEGVYQGVCGPTETAGNTARIVCASQTAHLIRISFVAQLTQVTSPLLGWIVDRFGAARMAFAMVAFHSTGAAIVLLALNYGVDPLFHLGFCLIAVHTWIGGLLCIHTSLYFANGRRRMLVTSILNSLFDASAIVYWGLWATRLWQTQSLLHLMGYYFALSILVYGASLYFWATAEPEAGADGHDPQEPPQAKNDGPSSLVIEKGIEKTPDSFATELPQSNQQEVNDNINLKDDASPRYIVVADRSPWQQVTSTYFIVLLIFFSIHIVGNQWTMSTVRDFLAELGDDAVGNRYLTYVCDVVVVVVVEWQNKIHNETAAHTSVCNALMHAVYSLS
jgi:hypothetical protein